MVSGGESIRDEVIDFTEDVMTIVFDRFNRGDCSGAATIQELRLLFSVGDLAEATLNGSTVTVSRVDLVDPVSGQEIKQIFWVDDRQTPFRFHHGIFAEDGGAVDAEGYPLQLNPAFAARVHGGATR